MNEKIKRLVRKALSEAPMDFGDYEERPHPRSQQKIEDPEGIYAKNKSFKRGVTDVENLASERFKEVVDKVKEYYNIQGNFRGTTLTSAIMSDFQSSLRRVLSIESGNKEKLRDLAVEISSTFQGWMPVRQEDIKDENGNVIFYANDPVTLEQGLEDGTIEKMDYEGGKLYLLPDINILTYFGSEQPISPEQFQMTPKENTPLPIPPNFSFDIDELTPEEKKQLEIDKRNVINAFIGAAGKRGQFYYLYYKNQLDAINPELFNLYNKIMSANDLMYFMNEDLIEMLGGNASGSARKLNNIDLPTSDDDEEEQNPREGIQTWEANGLIFPILLHELFKVFEMLPARSQWKGMDPGTATDIISQTDTLQNEPMNFRMMKLQQKLNVLLPTELGEPQGFKYIIDFKKLFYGMEVEEFHKLMNNIMSENPSDNDKAKNQLKDFYDEAVRIYDSYGEDEIEDDDDEEENYY